MLARFDVKSKVGGEIIDFDKLVELDNEGWRIITIVGDVNRTITHGAPQWALVQRSDDMLKAPKPDVDMDEDSSPVQPRVASSVAMVLSCPPMDVVSHGEAVKMPKPKKKGYKYGGMVKKDK